MAPKKKPVDRTPICDPVYLRRIDPLWIPGRVPPRFWQDRTHRRDYLLWFGSRLGFHVMEDFYRLGISACYQSGNGGRGLRSYWGTTAVEAVRDCFPQYDWKPWLFTRIPFGFWDSLANRRTCMAWLGERPGYRCMDDWYNVTVHDFQRNRGHGLMLCYRGSPARAVIDLIPGRNWCAWKFHYVPLGFWEAAENRHRYMRWLGKELGFRRPEDWYRIQAREIGCRHGKGLLQRYASLNDLMRKILRQLDWDRLDKRRPIQVKEVLVWADAHHARHGTWPTFSSGEIPGTVWNWLRIDSWLRHGRRGLPGETSLVQFLGKHCGIRVSRWRSLSEKQILAWARAHFRATGRWPSRNSGTIAQAPGNTWNAANQALVNGARGLPGGSSLAELLCRHGLK